MSWPDIAILAVIGVSVLVSLFRGFIREVFSLLVWIVAIWMALHFSGFLAVLLESWIDLPSARVIVAFVGIFLIVLTIGGLLYYLIDKLVQSTGLSATDRLLGAAFGGLRAVVIMVAVVIVLSLTPFRDDPWWNESRLLPEFQRLAEWSHRFFPETVRDYLATLDDDQPGT